MGNKKPRYPIREYLGKYGRWVLVMKGRAWWKFTSTTLDRLQEMFPTHLGVEHFTSVELADYRAVRLRHGIASTTLRLEFMVFNQFWTWLREDRGLMLNNPARAVLKSIAKPKGTKAIGGFSLQAVEQLLAECPTNVEKRFVLGILTGGPLPTGRAYREIKNAALRIGWLGFSFKELRVRSRSRFALDVIKAYCQQVLDSLTPEPQPESNPFRTIESTPLDEGATVSDYSHDTPVVHGVNQ